MVVVVGGCTSSEIQALRDLSQEMSESLAENKNEFLGHTGCLIGTTDIINGDSMLKELLR